jgi:hypothetical protein
VHFSKIRHVWFLAVRWILSSLDSSHIIVPGLLSVPGVFFQVLVSDFFVWSVWGELRVALEFL